MSPEEAHITRPFFPMIKRADDVLARLTHLESEMAKYKIKNLKCTNHKLFLEAVANYTREVN